MAALTPASKAAIARLRAFSAPPTQYYNCPLTRRAAVLILLYADRRGDLRVVLTIRSAGLKNYAGQAALPGGKADTLQETPFHTARREAFEEIGLPISDHRLPPGYSVEHLAELPVNLSTTELSVRPCVAYLQAPAPSPRNPAPDAARDLLPKLDAKEVAAVFTAPFHNFLRARDEEPALRDGVPGEWYRGSWHNWQESAWRMHHFHVPVTPSTVFLARHPHPATASSADVERTQTASSKNKPVSGQCRSARSSSTLQPALPSAFDTIAGDALQQPRYRVFGMTARILVDCARVAYGEEPEFEHNSHFGDEERVQQLLGIGRLSEVRREGDGLTREVLLKAKQSKM